MVLAVALSLTVIVRASVSIDTISPEARVVAVVRSSIAVEPGVVVVVGRRVTGDSGADALG